VKDNILLTFILEHASSVDSTPFTFCTGCDPRYWEEKKNASEIISIWVSLLRDPSGQNQQKTVWMSAFGTQNTVPCCQKYSYRLIFQRFCPLGYDRYIWGTFECDLDSYTYEST